MWNNGDGFQNQVCHQDHPFLLQWCNGAAFQLIPHCSSCRDQPKLSKQMCSCPNPVLMEFQGAAPKAVSFTKTMKERGWKNENQNLSKVPKWSECGAGASPSGSKWPCSSLQCEVAPKRRPEERDQGISSVLSLLVDPMWILMRTSSPETFRNQAIEKSGRS